MDVVVTGSSGRLGRALVRALLDAGHKVTAVDRVSVDDDAVNFHAADLSEPLEASLTALLRSSDAIAHCASVHPWKTYSDLEYITANVLGTWNLYGALRGAGVPCLLTSSIAARGLPVPPSDWPVGIADEHAATDMYCMSKRTQEGIAEAEARVLGTRTLSLRPGPFLPKTFPQLGPALLRGGLTLEDVVSAHLSALGRLVSASGPPFEAFYLSYPLPYGADDAGILRYEGIRCVNVLRLAERYWPAGTAALGKFGTDFDGPIYVYDTRLTGELLGWGPTHTIEWWIDAAESGRHDREGQWF